ncbi:hypothetical protein CQW23_28709 [Capsicum baccatum]|uniref:DUF4219 domain-containing protein n=1 Tax=Capsicum baccatum TaxID=33114 RepID=A0A2G2VHC3_CAPBA|nr:hypothetical protein CQW23_28709 [Capsicum baccatum]
MASKNIISDLNKEEKLNRDNYDIWSRKVWYILEEENDLEDSGAIDHVSRDREVFVEFHRVSPRSRLQIDGTKRINVNANVMKFPNPGEFFSGEVMNVGDVIVGRFCGELTILSFGLDYFVHDGRLLRNECRCYEISKVLRKDIADFIKVITCVGMLLRVAFAKVVRPASDRNLVFHLTSLLFKLPMINPYSAEEGFLPKIGKPRYVISRQLMSSLSCQANMLE